MVPGPMVTSEDTAFNFTGASALERSRRRCDQWLRAVYLDSTNGTLTLSSAAGITFNAGDGTADATMTFTGTLVSVNAVLANVTFTPNPNFAGTAVVTLQTNDLGNRGGGGASGHGHDQRDGRRGE